MNIQWIFSSTIEATYFAGVDAWQQLNLTLHILSKFDSVGLKLIGFYFKSMMELRCFGINRFKL